mmetsp:Transcript_28838/g.29254  ORF Transcript_28838/g.29254 Transcript_28838/m.29254 type:complete len:177 (+) Transcript_28838:80-610(+)
MTLTNEREGKRICVHSRTVSGGLDYKFETDPYNSELHGLLTVEQYTDAIENLNKKLRPCRAGAIDGALLITGPLLVPLALWGVRHCYQTKKRKRLLKEGIREFNIQYQELLMRWNRRPESQLTIEKRPNHNDVVINDNNVLPNNTHFVREEVSMVQATLVSDSTSVLTTSSSNILV